MRGIDPTNPESMQGLLDGGLFDLPKSPAQEAALQRLEVTLALVEGWVDEVVGQATAERMPAAAKMQEAVRRRRAAGGPAEQTFATLVGLELRPRRLRDASTLWGSLRTRQGTEARDGVWMHPDLLPTAADLDDPLGFREDAAAPERAERGRLRRRAARAARRRAGDARHRRRRPSEPARRRAGRARARWAAPTPAQAALRERYVAHLRGPPRRDAPRLLPRPPDRRHAGARRRPATQVLLNLHRKARRWFAFGGHCEPGDPTLAGGRAARGDRGVRARRTCASTRSRSSSTSTRCRFCDPRGDGAPPRRPLRRAWPRRRRRHAVSEESLDVRWWPVDALPDLEPEMLELIAAGALRAGQRRVDASVARRTPGGGSSVRRGRPAQQVALGPLGLRVAVDPRPELARRGRARAGAPARGPARSRSPTPASPAAGRRAGWCGHRACTSPSATSGSRPSAPLPGVARPPR